MTDESDHKRATSSSFGAAAAEYLDSGVHRRGEDLRVLAEWCADVERVVDVAAGAGHTTGAVADASDAAVVAVDASPEMVRTATESFDAVGVVADAERLPFGTDTVDAVTCRIAAHHFPDPERFVAEMARVLGPGSVFAFEDNVAPEDPELGAFLNRIEALRDPTHIESYTLAQWRRWLVDAGFDVHETRTLRKRLAYDDWVTRTDPPAARRAELESLLTNPPAGAAETLDIEVEDGKVVAFANLKGLVRATA
jgi:ubiquinone/menaquinone biosynthesis C-methylase UbiE